MTKVLTKKQKTAFNKTAIHPLQSWQWGEFRKAWGNEVLFIKHGIITLHKIPSGLEALLGWKPLTKYKIGTFLKGPKPTKKMLLDLKKIAKENNLIFIKLEPNVVMNIHNINGGHPEFSSGSDLKRIPKQVRNDKKRLIELLKNNGCVHGKTLFTPTTFWIDLTKSEDELMKSFSSKTRYNIRLAKRKGVEIIEDPTSLKLRGAGNSNKAFEKYIELTRETVERQGFYAHSEKYHRLMWKHLHQLPIRNSQLPIARLLTAVYQNKIITTWIVFVWKDFLYYPYGASSDKHKNVMASNLMMWEAIRFGKKLGLKTFDLWGREPGKGFTKFKEGYSPKVVEFLGTWDLIASPLYYPYRLAESIRWLLLRLKSRIKKPNF
jgi:lipid II:glycine glycyltransferase (peptidoglycan interpeptide bridge formation enzyme)